MDIVTQGLIGAACAGSGARRAEIRTAIGIGAVAGMAADLDVLIRSGTDPLLVLEYHRHFTHALVFVPFGALIVAGLAWLLLRHRLGFGRIYLYAFLGYLPSGLLDAFTSYGTHLLWPFSDERIAWSAIAVVDPVFSLALLFGLLMAGWRRQANAARIGLALALLYLGWGVTQRDRAEAVASVMAARRGHAVLRMEAKPTIGNLLLWRIVYDSGARFHVDAVRVPPWGAPKLYPGSTVAKFDPQWLGPIPPGSVLADDLARFDYFSDGWLVVHPQDPMVIGDLRYSGVPNGVRPLWGIRVDPGRPQQHVAFETFRSFSAQERAAFMRMLRGRPLLPADGVDAGG
jgi:inner membrane protein